MPKKKIIIAEGKFRVGEPWHFTMSYTEEISEEEMEDKLAALNGKKGTLIFVPDS